RQQQQQQQRGADSDEQEIASRTVQVQSKRFYLDVKQNRRGRFLKIAEVGSNGQKSRILMSMSSTTEFRDKLSELVKFYKQLEAGGATGDHGNGPRFKSESMVKDNRRYYLDLKENQRGKFLRVAQQVPQTGMRSQIAMPAEGMSELKEKLTELIEECGTDDLGDNRRKTATQKSRQQKEDRNTEKASSRRKTATQRKQAAEGRPQHRESKQQKEDRNTEKASNRRKTATHRKQAAEGRPQHRESKQQKEDRNTEQASSRRRPQHIESKQYPMAQNMLRVAELEEQLRINEQSLYVMDRSETAKRQQLVAEIRRLDVAITRLKREDNARARVQGRDGVEQLPGPKSFRAMGKIFYFDVGANRRGTFLRVSEVHASYRTAVTVPDKCWANMRDILNELIENDSKQPAAPEAAKN
uniref:PURA n=1 Tax=Macrostomum lignano TaxID=282301 RepID=A0A1I8G9C6_9PLAT